MDKKLRLIKQKGSVGCGVACVAMLAGVTYANAAAKLCELGQPLNWTKAVHLRRGLATFGFGLGRGMRITSVRVLASLDQHALVGTNKRKYNRWHWIVWDARCKIVLDPKKPPYRINRLRPFSCYPLMRI